MCLTAMTDRGPGNLTDKQRVVLEMVANGYSYSQIGKQMFITPGSVRRHVEAVRRRLNAANTHHAIATAFRVGILK